ncbi:MAG: hypothetical protein BRC22_01140 [Parcubacteria group bacterium QH_9_35_7]|nr:MAG: hypothetical protein BRC22_01140 [Parcubacteria group bacterium QH_9_35_7]
MNKKMPISIKKIKTIFYGLMTVILFAFLAIPTKAAEKPDLNISDSGYQAQYVSQNISDPIEIEAGSTKTVTIKFKNTGSKKTNSQGVKNCKTGRDRGIENKTNST